jgi:hypothetical protein
MSEPGNDIRWQIRDHEKRVTKLEDSGAGADHEKRILKLEKYNLGVFDQRLKALDEDVKSLKRAFYTFAFGVVGSAVVFAFTVFALLGK